ncbi:MAG: helix-turn-helix domain-containing protein [Flavobacteriales bacterium AspAUS03]
MKSIEKNTYKSNIKEIKTQSETYFALIDNETNQTDTIAKHIGKEFIQFYFCTKGMVSLHFNQGHYQLPIRDGFSFLLYNPMMELPMNLNISRESRVVIVLISVKTLHVLFLENADHIPFLNAENVTKKFYAEKEISPAISMVLSQMEHYVLNDSLKKLYYNAKVCELFALYFYNGQNSENHCPFLSNEVNIHKIKKAKDLLIKNVADPPSLKTLTTQVGLNDHQLKEGFKKIFSTTIYGYLLDYKLNIAREKLEEQRMQVQEVAYLLGYENPSHFIKAFKKKYGITPKKYLGTLN